MNKVSDAVDVKAILENGALIHVGRSSVAMSSERQCGCPKGSGHLVAQT